MARHSIRDVLREYHLPEATYYAWCRRGLIKPAYGEHHHPRYVSEEDYQRIGKIIAYKQRIRQSKK